MVQMLQEGTIHVSMGEIWELLTRVGFIGDRLLIADQIFREYGDLKGSVPISKIWEALLQVQAGKATLETIESMLLDKLTQPERTTASS